MRMSRREKTKPRTATRFAGAALLLLVSLIASPAGAQLFNPQLATLANGAQLVVIENHRTPAVELMVYYKVGAADEEAGRTGLAHYLEHLMFKGTTTRRPGEFTELITKNGGQFNAFTTDDYTAYHETISADRLALVMELEADRMANLVIDEATAKPELQVVLEERRMRVENQPSALMWERVSATLFTLHPYRNPTIGWPEQVAALTADEARSFHERWYAPNNAIILVAGDVTMATVRPLADKFFGSIAARPVPKRERLSEPAPLTARSVEFESDRVRQPQWSRLYHAPVYRTAKDNAAFALQVLAEILGGGETSRLYKRLVVTDRLANSAYASYDPTARDYGIFSVSANARDASISRNAIEAAMQGELRLIREKGVSETELKDAIGRMRASATYARDSLGTGARLIGAALATDSAIENVEQWPARIAAVTVSQVNDAAKAILKDDVAVTSWLKPAPQS